MLDVVQILEQPPAFRRPVLVAAFEGWNDAGEAASGSLTALRQQVRGIPFAGIDPEEFFDFQAVRPTVHISDGGSRNLEWPANEFSWAQLPGTDRHIILLSGTEPSLRWQTFSRGVTEFARRMGVELVLTLGALQIDVPHTRAVPVTATSSDPQVARDLGLRRSTYEGPTGITGVLHQGCSYAGLNAVSMWAGVPHYLAGAPYLAARLALSERVVSLLGADLSLDQLAREAASQRDEVAKLMEEDSDLAEYVHELEERSEPSNELDLTLPQASGDELAAEFERYLRDRGSDG